MMIVFEDKHGLTTSDSGRSWKRLLYLTLWDYLIIGSKIRTQGKTNDQGGQDDDTFYPVQLLDEVLC